MSKLKTDWNLKNLDTGEVLNPPYPVSEEGLKYQGLGGNYAESQRFRMDSVSNWISSKTRTFQFSTVLFAETSGNTVEQDFYKLKKLSSVDEDLGRPPICVFSYGKLSVIVLVDDVAVTIKPPRDDGTFRLINLDISLRKYKPFSQVQIDPASPTKESYYLVVSEAECSYERIARRYYGSALAGDRIRKRHPEMPFQPTTGSKVHLPSKSIILREVVAPSCHSLNCEEAATMEVFQDLLDRRSARKVLF